MAIDILDENSDDTTIPHMKVMNGCVIYSKVELSSQKEEIIAFDYSGGVTRVRVNDSVRVFEEWQIYLIMIHYTHCRQMTDTPVLLILIHRNVNGNLAVNTK